VGVEDRINWDYFAKQTAGLSAAHISAAMNSSLLKVISENYFSDYLKPAKKKSRTNTFQFVPLIQDRIKKLVFQRNSKTLIHTLTLLNTVLKWFLKLIYKRIAIVLKPWRN
jgi:hypothetical protein